MPSFSLSLPPSTKRDVPVEDIKAKDTERLFIDLDGSMISPFMTTEPGWGATASVGDPAHGAPAAAQRPQQSRKFFRVDNNNLFIYIADEKPGAGQGNAESTPTTKERQTSDSLTTTVEENSIPLDELEILGVLGSGSQGSVRACRHDGVNYAIKTIPVSDALDKSQADVERQARKAGIVRELRMVAKKKGRHNDHVVAVHNAYFKQKDLLILMERMSTSLEDLQTLLQPLQWNAVKTMAQKIFGQHFGGSNIQSGSTFSLGGGKDSSRKGHIVASDDEDAAFFHSPPGSKETDSPNLKPIGFRGPPSTPKGAVGFYKESDVERTSPLPECVIGIIAKDSLLGLQHFHEHIRVVHTDLKPGNIMFSQNQQLCKLADFGCNMELDENGVVPHNSGVALGTKLYMSPERWAEAGEGFDAKSDVWSLGITLMELANGCHPCVLFKEDFWSFETHLKIEKMVRPLHCSAIFYDFLCKCLTRDPQKRPSASQLLHHDFIKKYQNVPRTKLATFLKTIAKESRQSHIREAQSRMQSLLAVAVQTQDNDLAKKNAKTWQGYNGGRGIGSRAPSYDTSNFPTLT